MTKKLYCFLLNYCHNIEKTVVVCSDSDENVCQYIKDNIIQFSDFFVILKEIHFNYNELSASLQNEFNDEISLLENVENIVSKYENDDLLHQFCAYSNDNGWSMDYFVVPIDEILNNDTI
jgi:hypothetical protein